MTLEKKDTYKGYAYYIVAQDIGYRCGYVEVPSNHPYFCKEYTHLGHIDVHGGLTYSSSNLGEWLTDSWFLGFDCAHMSDLYDESIFAGLKPKQRSMLLEVNNIERNNIYNKATIKTVEFVEEELQNLIDQLIDCNPIKDDPIHRT